MKEHDKKLNSLNKVKPRIKDNKNKRLEVIINNGNIYKELQYIYKSKYNKKIDSSSAKTKKKAWLQTIKD